MPLHEKREERERERKKESRYETSKRSNAGENSRADTILQRGHVKTAALGGQDSFALRNISRGIIVKYEIHIHHPGRRILT